MMWRLRLFWLECCHEEIIVLLCLRFDVIGTNWVFGERERERERGEWKGYDNDNIDNIDNSIDNIAYNIYIYDYNIIRIMRIMKWIVILKKSKKKI